MKEIISNCVLYITRAIMRVIYFFMKIFPIKQNKITMLSRQSDVINIDFQLLLDKMKQNRKQANVVVLCKKMPKSFIKRMAYCFYMIKCMYHIATSKVCIIDGYNIPISALNHKKKLVIIQIWHAMGAIKKFGYQVLNKEEGYRSKVANIMKMHCNYKMVTCTSKITRDFYVQAFQTEQEKILLYGMPRVDYLLGRVEKARENQERLLTKYPILKEKKNIVYVPTFRKGKQTKINELIQAVDTQKYNLILRLHPLEMQEVDGKYTIGKEFETQDILRIADYIITDYSAIAFEAALLEKPVYFYLYDIEEYQQNRGLNVKLQEEIPHATFSNIQGIIQNIEKEQYCYEELYSFKNKYIETVEFNNTEKIVEYIMKSLEE